MFIEVDHIQQPLACCVARWGTRLGHIKRVDIDEYRFTSTASLSRERLSSDDLISEAKGFVTTHLKSMEYVFSFEGQARSSDDLSFRVQCIQFGGRGRTLRRCAHRIMICAQCVHILCFNHEPMLTLFRCAVVSQRLLYLFSEL